MIVDHVRFLEGVQVKPAEGRTGRGGRRAVIAALISVLAASCSTDGDVPFGFATVGPEDRPTRSSDFAQATIHSAADASMTDENDPSLPEAVAAAPQPRPGSETELAATEPEAAPEQLAAMQDASPPPAAEAPAEAAQPEAEAIETAAAPEEAAPAIDNIAPAQVAAAPEPKKRGFLSSFFGTQARASAAPQPIRPLIQTERGGSPQIASAAPMTQLASTEPVPAARLVPEPSAEAGNALPGVRQNALFEIKRRSGIDDDSDIDLHEGEELYQVASAAGLARLAPNGFLKQTEHVDIACLKQSLVRVLKSIEGHYGKKVVVTSGYRNPDRNRKARGARNSLHMYCAAADVQVEGVSKWDLATFVRSMPGRGGVGTYCHTDSVHVDVGPERDWNWRCRRRG